MTDLWRLTRAHNLGLAAAGVLAGGWIALRAVALPKLLVFAAVSGIGLGAAGNVANDLQDVAADRLNPRARLRPLAAGRVPREMAHLVVWLGALVGCGAAALISGWQLVVALAALAVLLGYSPWLKRHGPAGNVAVAVVGGLPLWYGALAVGRPAAGIVPWTIAAWLHLVREIVKDLEDEAGDRVVGRRTLPIRVGSARAAGVVWWACLAFLPLSVVLPLADGYPAVYFAVAGLAQVLVVVVGHRVRRGRLAAASPLLKVAMVIGLAGLVLGGVA